MCLYASATIAEPFPLGAGAGVLGITTFDTPALLELAFELELELELEALFVEVDTLACACCAAC